VRPVSLAYIGRFSRVGQDLSFSASYSRNIPGGANGDDAAFAADNQRDGANPKYSIWRESVSFSQLLPSDFILRALANAQQTHDALVAGEQFGMGGVDSVRATTSAKWRTTSAGACRSRRTAGFRHLVRQDRRAARAGFRRCRARPRQRAAAEPRQQARQLRPGGSREPGQIPCVPLDVARVTQDAGTRQTGDWRAHFPAANGKLILGLRDIRFV